GPPPAKPLDMSMTTQKQKEAEDLARHERVRETGKKLLSAALDFLTELLPKTDTIDPTPTNLGDQLRSTLSHYITRDDTDNAQLRIPLSEAVLDKFTAALEAMLSHKR
ncbi:MAG: hypothetical protein FWD53_10815, partial [Phycisphaerales bacterium]|nr:hypothetical protein [Phycisphaerales bacterium]